MALIATGIAVCPGTLSQTKVMSPFQPLEAFTSFTSLRAFAGLYGISEADPLSIEQLMNRYAWAIDTHDWGALRDIFAPTAIAVYCEGEVVDVSLRGIDEIASWLEDQLGKRVDTHPWHFITNHVIEVRGDGAESRHYLHNRHLTIVGHYYVSWVRTSEGWRIATMEVRGTVRNGPLPESPVSG